MAFNNNFQGKLDETTVRDIVNKLNYDKVNLSDRMDEIKKILGETDFYTEYFSDYFKAGITCGTPLSTDNNVCKSLEKMANYILNSKEVKKAEDEEAQKYTFFTDAKYFDEKVRREHNVDGNNNDSMAFLTKPSRNYKKDKTQTITKEDLARTDFLGEILRGYNSHLEVASKKLKDPRDTTNRYLLTKAVNEITEDMVTTKDQLLGIWGYDFVSSKESTDYDLDSFDFTDKTHLKGGSFDSWCFGSKRNTNGSIINHRGTAKGLIFFKRPFEPQSDMSHILWDLQNTINQANLTSTEKEILEDLRNGCSQVEIQEQYGISQPRVSHIIDTIVRKIIKVGNKYDRKSNLN